MKNLLRSLILTLFFSGTALASQFEVYIAHPANPDASTSEFSGFLQKSISIDTRTKTIRVPVTPTCLPNQLCSESIYWMNYTLTSVSFENRIPVRLVAISGSSQITIQANADHSTLIEVLNSKGSAKAHFIGSPFQPPQYR